MRVVIFYMANRVIVIEGVESEEKAYLVNMFRKYNNYIYFKIDYNSFIKGSIQSSLFGSLKNSLKFKNDETILLENSKIGLEIFKYLTDKVKELDFKELINNFEKEFIDSNIEYIIVLPTLSKVKRYLKKMNNYKYIDIEQLYNLYVKFIDELIKQKKNITVIDNSKILNLEKDVEDYIEFNTEKDFNNMIFIDVDDTFMIPNIINKINKDITYDEFKRLQTQNYNFRLYLRKNYPELDLSKSDVNLITELSYQFEEFNYKRFIESKDMDEYSINAIIHNLYEDYGLKEIDFKTMMFIKIVLYNYKNNNVENKQFIFIDDNKKLLDNIEQAIYKYFSEDKLKSVNKDYNNVFKIGSIMVDF